MIDIALGSREIRIALLPALALAFWLSPAAGWAYTYEQQQACMVRQQSELSPGCRAQFRPQSTEAGRPTHWRRHRPIRHADAY